MRAHKRLLAAALGIVLVLAAVLPGVLTPRPAPRYLITDLGVLPGDGESTADAINNGGDIACVSTPAGSRDHGGHGGSQACLYRGGRLTNIGVLPGGSDSSAQAINARGDVTGLTSMPAGSHAFLYSGGRMRDLGVPPGYTDSAGVGISGRGEVAVNATNSAAKPGSPRGHAFFYSGGHLRDIVLPPGCSESCVTGISASGQILGTYRPVLPRHGWRRPFLCDARTGAMTLLPIPAAYLGGRAYQVNVGGQIIGDVLPTNGDRHAALWRGGHVDDLGTLPGDSVSIGSALNGQGEAVGSSSREDDPVQSLLRGSLGGLTAVRNFLDRGTTRAFVYAGGRMQDLNELIPRSADWTLQGASDINDKGQIVGSGLHHGRQRAFLLTPIR